MHFNYLAAESLNSSSFPCPYYVCLQYVCISVCMFSVFLYEYMHVEKLGKARHRTFDRDSTHQYGQQLPQLQLVLNSFLCLSFKFFPLFISELSCQFSPSLRLTLPPSLPPSSGSSPSCCSSLLSSCLPQSCLMMLLQWIF